MGAYVFNNQIFDSWLTRMSEEILSKVNREKITTEEMIILILKAQTNHFHHMDSDMNDNISELRTELKTEIAEVKEDMKSLRDEVKADFHKLDAKMDSRFMWSMGITITLSLGLYLKLFLG